MMTECFTLSCNLTDIPHIQKGGKITYTIDNSSEKRCHIEATMFNDGIKTDTEGFYCYADYEGCVSIITMLKENCVYPGQCADIVEDLGLKILSK